MTDQNNAAQAWQDTVHDAILILTEEADALSDCHTRAKDDWAQEPEAKARYDHILAVAEALSKLRAPVADEDRRPTAPDDDAIAECWINASDCDGIAYDGPSFERGYRAALASAPVAGEAISDKRLWLMMAPWHLHMLRAHELRDVTEFGRAAYAAGMADAALQASEAVRVQQLEAARNGAIEEVITLLENHITVSHFEFCDSPEGPTNLIVSRSGQEVMTEAIAAIRALKTQADKDGGDCAKGAGDVRDTGKDRLAFHIWALVRGMDITVNDSCGYQSPLTQRAWMRWNPSEPATGSAGKPA